MKIYALPVFMCVIFASLLSILFLIPPLTKNALSVASHVVISEIQIGGTDADDEFIELYNPTGNAIVMTGWRLSAKTGSGKLYNFVGNLNGTIPAYGYLLLTPPDSIYTQLADVVYTSYHLSNNYSVILYRDAGVTPEDKIGMGDPADFETAPADLPPEGMSIERKANPGSTVISMDTGGLEEFAGNGADSDNNSTDFLLRNTPQPQNSQSAAEVPAVPTSTPTTIPTPTATPVITPSSTPIPTPSATPTPTSIPENTATPTPTDMMPSPSPTAIAQPVETPIPTPNVTPTVTPTPAHPTPFVLGVANFPGRRLVCYLKYRSIRLLSFWIRFPYANCR